MVLQNSLRSSNKGKLQIIYEQHFASFIVLLLFMLFLIIELSNSRLRPHCVCLHKFLNHQHTSEFKAFFPAETKLTKKKQAAQRWSHSAQGQTQILGFLFNVIPHIMTAHFLLLSPSSSPFKSINFIFKEYLQYLWLITNCSSLGEKRGVVLWAYFSQFIYLLIIVGFLHWNNF